MAIGGSELWIEGGGERWPMVQQSVSIVFLTPSLRSQEVEKEREREGKTFLGIRNEGHCSLEQCVIS